MAWKLATLVVAALLIGAGILAERHRQFQAAHELAAAHRQIDHSRRELWQLQADLARRLRPDVLTADLQQHGRPFGPVTPEPPDAVNTPAPPLTALADPIGAPTP